MSQIPPYDSDPFPLPSLEEWQKAAGKSLDWTSHDGLTLSALYHQGPQAPAARTAARPWLIREDFSHTIPAVVGRSVRASLEGGATTVGLLQDEAGRRGWDPDQPEADGLVGRGGICLSTVPDLRTALDTYPWNSHSMHLEVGASGAPMLGILVGLAIERGADFPRLNATVACDPLGELARAGRLDWELDDLYREAATGFLYAREFCPRVRVMAVNTEAYHEAGANSVQELALGLATGMEYFRQLQAQGLKPAEAARALAFSWSVSGDLFSQVAKLRAARGLWNRLLGLHGVAEPERVSFFHARTGLATHSWLDPHSNLLRSALAGFAAVLGGADSVEVAPFDRHLEHASNDPDAARLARNQQLLMLYEAQLHRVKDPAAGSYYLEHLTQELAARTWADLQDLELPAALLDGRVARLLAETGQNRRERVSDGVDVLVGVNRYPLEPTPRGPVPFDQAAMQADRREHMGRVRNGRDGGDVAHRLNRVATVAGSLDPALIDAAAQAARVGATLGEITRAIRKPAVSPLEIPPIEKRCLAHPLEVRA